jgi:hypothetical protein
VTKKDVSIQPETDLSPCEEEHAINRHCECSEAIQFAVQGIAWIALLRFRSQPLRSSQ